VGNEAKQDFLKQKDKKKRGENKCDICCQRKKKRGFSFFIFKKTSRIEDQATHDQKEKNGGKKNISGGFSEIPDGEKTR